MYTLIIVDDEYTIRKGLKQYIPWESFGFEVSGIFEDGLSALSFLEQHPVDVVLTDIDMPMMNGIKLIELIRQKEFATYCVVISGYQDFNYAKQLIPFQITDYILKPINNEYVQTIFIKLKKELDESFEQKRLVSQNHAHMKRMQDTLLQQCLSDLILNHVSYSQTLKHMEKLDLGIDLATAQILYCDLKIMNLNELLHKNWHYGIDALYDSIFNYLKANLKYTLFDLIKTQDTLCLISLDATQKDISKLLISFKTEVKKACDSIHEISSIKLQVLDVNHYTTQDILTATPMGQNPITIQFPLSIGNDSVDLNHFLTSINSALLEHDFDTVNERLDALLQKTIVLSNEQVQEIYEKLLNILNKNNSDSKEISQSYKIQLKSCNTSLECHNLIIDCIRKMKTCIISDTNHQIDELMNQALAYIEKNYQKDISRNDVSDYVFLSASYFSRCFKQRTNMKFIDYLTKVRIEKACELLLDPANKINDVCYAVGYNSPSYFTRVFKYFIGTTPNDYIRSNVCTKEIQ